MREFIYLSESKLRHFITDQSPSWPSRVRVEGEIKVPGVGGVKVGPADRDHGKWTGVDLEKVISALESSSRAARWFADDEARPGQWVYFEAPLSYTAIRQTAVFLDLEEPTSSYPTGGAIRLLLHGSYIHLVGSPATLPSTREIAKSLGISRSLFHSMIIDLSEYLNEAEAGHGDFAVPTPGATPKLQRVRFERIIRSLGEVLDLSHTAAWMSGYARITAMMPSSTGRRIVVATPLYVEYATEPQSAD